MTDQPPDLTNASDGELAEVATRIQAEVTRREAEDANTRAARLRQEVAEVKAGTRLARQEHILQLSPAETAALVESGALKHLGFGASKRRGRR